MSAENIPAKAKTPTRCYQLLSAQYLLKPLFSHLPRLYLWMGPQRKIGEGGRVMIHDVSVAGPLHEATRWLSPASWRRGPSSAPAPGSWQRTGLISSKNQLIMGLLTGTVSQDFRLLVFFMNQFSPSIWVYHYGHFDFFRKFAEIFAALGAPPVSMTPVENLQAEKL